jgi:hypothetical protein
LSARNRESKQADQPARKFAHSAPPRRPVVRAPACYKLPIIRVAAQAARRQLEGELLTMVLKAPGIVTFMLSVILTVAVLIDYFFGSQIPFLTDNKFGALLLAQVILIMGCIMRGL